MNAAKILLVEDELITANAIKVILEGAGYQVVGIASSGEDAVIMTGTTNPDIILMDIHLDSLVNGIEVAEQINRFYAGTPLIYLTKESRDVFFEDAIRTYPLNYITKPFSEQELLRAVTLALQYSGKKNNNNSDEVFVYRKSTEYGKLLISSIVYLKASGAYTDIYTDPDEHTTKPAGLQCVKVALSSNRVIAQLNAPDILQVHRSYFINIRKIDTYNTGTVYLRGVKIPVSRSYKDTLKSRINLLVTTGHVI